MKNIKTITITGLPSVQKNRLSHYLKEKYQSKPLQKNTNFIGTNFSYYQILNFLQEHLERKQTKDAKKSIQVQDLDLLGTLIWMEIQFKRYPIWLANYIKSNTSTLYLVVADSPPRLTAKKNSPPSFSTLFQDKLYYYLDKFKLNYSTISGKGEVILMNAILECDFSLRQYNGFTFFMEPSSPLSQWHPSEFEVDGISFCCGEQFMMYKKAMLFNDIEMADKIMATPHPNEHQAFGRSVRGFKSKVWKQHCRNIVYRGNYAKFTQNRWLWDILDNTKDSLLVEAYDQCNYWSVGLVEENPTIKNPKLWPGKNWIGFILTRVREDIRNQCKAKAGINQYLLCAAEN